MRGTDRVIAWNRTNGSCTPRHSARRRPYYAEHRPDYARAAVRWAVEPVPRLRVLDLGAGTGKLTATLVGVGADVAAVESDRRC
jgi:2-polyprenyl-3-methyl-5-hydroxy-6-metoxy-1,4-benzoquinol methylase